MARLVNGEYDRPSRLIWNICHDVSGQQPTIFGYIFHCGESEFGANSLQQIWCASLFVQTNSSIRGERLAISVSVNERVCLIELIIIKIVNFSIIPSHRQSC